MTPADDIAQSARPVRVRLVGPLRVYVDGRRLADPPLGRAASLLALLAVDAGHLVPVDRIIDDLWPTGPPAKAKENVASLVSRLRRVVGRDCIEGSRSGYRLVLSDGVRIDFRDAEAAVIDAETQLSSEAGAAACTAAREALTILDAGELLEDDPYAQWAEAPRRRAETLQRRARRVLWTASLELEDPRTAAEATGAAVESDPFDEEAHPARIVREPRALLAEMGLTLGDDVEIRVWDSSSEVGYFVLPERPAGTENLSEEELAALVTRDAMPGIAHVAGPV